MAGSGGMVVFVRNVATLARAWEISGGIGLTHGLATVATAAKPSLFDLLHTME
jgi:hypothetical protein